jgi:hypothetical protein
LELRIQQLGKKQVKILASQEPQEAIRPQEITINQAKNLRTRLILVLRIFNRHITDRR